jgi:hypothetical protein
MRNHLRPAKKPAQNNGRRVSMPRPSAPRLKLRISKAIDALVERVPEESFSVSDKEVLRRIKEKLSGAVGDTRLTEADYANMKKIAKKYRIQF